MSFPEKGASVPFSRKTSYCSGVSFFLNSSSFLGMLSFIYFICLTKRKGKCLQACFRYHYTQNMLSIIFILDECVECFVYNSYFLYKHIVFVNFNLNFLR